MFDTLVGSQSVVSASVVRRDPRQSAQYASLLAPYMLTA
jgi:hypothetical protein